MKIIPFILLSTLIIVLICSCNNNQDKFEGRWQVIEFLEDGKSEIKDVSGGNKDSFLWEFQSNNISFMYGDKIDGMFGEVEWKINKRKQTIELYAVEHERSINLNYYFIDNDNLTLKGEVDGRALTFLLKK